VREDESLISETDTEAAARLTVHESRREAGIPTVSTLVGDTSEAAAVFGFAWAHARGRTLLVVEPPFDTAARTWYAATVGRSGMRAASFDYLAGRLGTGPIEAANRYHDDRDRTLVDCRADFAVDLALRSAIDGASPEATWQAVRERPHAATAQGRMLRACLEIYGELRAPSVVLTLAPGTAAEVIRTAAALAEAAPGLCVLVACSRHDADALPLQRHDGALLAEGLVPVPAARDFAGTDVTLDAALSAARLAREHLDEAGAGTPDWCAAAERARSEAERLLFLALERHPLTRNRFELNGTIDALFGGRALEIDLLDRRGRTAIEVDGYHHFRDADRYRRDRRKDALLQSEGYFVLRTLAEDVVDRLDDVLLGIVENLQRNETRGAWRSGR
jgi:very-short-patch-repair endonuclease